MLARLINLLAFVTLFEMMITIGLRVTLAEVGGVARNGGLVARAMLANYALVPAITVGLLLLFRADAMVSAGFLIVAVCPGAPYAPPLTALGKGNVVSAVGLMFILAASSALLAPLLLRFLLPIVGGGETPSISFSSLVGTLAFSQFLPLCIGLGVRHRRPALAAKLEPLAAKLSAALNLVLMAVIIAAQFSTLARIRLNGYFGMGCLLLLSMLAGWILGGSTSADRKTLAIVTGVRNAGVSLLIAVNMMPGTAAVTAATAYALLQTIGAALIAAAWGRLTADAHPPTVSIAPHLTERST